MIEVNFEITPDTMEKILTVSRKHGMSFDQVLDQLLGGELEQDKKDERKGLKLVSRRPEGL